MGNEELKKESIYINTSIVLSMIITILPLWGVFVISNSWWGILIKIFLMIFILFNLRNYFFHPIWQKAMGFGAGIVINMIWFSLAWFFYPESTSYLFVVLFLLGIGTMKYILEKHYNNAG